MVLIHKWPFLQLLFFLRIQARKMSFTIFQNKKTFFQAIKKGSSKTRKIDIFPKWLTHGFGPKMAIFSTFFQAIQARISSLTIFQNEQTPFQALKTRSSKTRNIHFSPKGLTHGFGPKMAIFPTFFFSNIGQENVFFTTFQNKKTSVQAIKTRSSKSQEIDIFPKGLTHGFGPKMALFSTLFFQAIQARKMPFTIFQNEQTFFQAIKTRSSKTRNIHFFQKGITHGFGPKMGIFPIFFFSNIGQENVFFYDILEQKNVCLGYKNKKFKNSKHSHFSKGVNP